jgi:phospholipid-translocating ATPase
MVIVFELSISAIRRIFWPQDQDLMQEAEKYAGVLDVMKEHAAEVGEAGAASRDDAAAVAGDADADARPSQHHEWNGRGSLHAGRRRSRKISGDVYGAPPLMATPEERDVDPLDGAGSVVGPSRDNMTGKQKSITAETYRVDP